MAATSAEERVVSGSTWADFCDTLGENEALVIEVTPPPCDYWNFQLDNHWMESLDYRYHRVALDHHEAVAEPDGSLRIVVSHGDPGVPNWIETAGHRRGTMCLRWIGAREHPTPATRVVELGNPSSAQVE